MSTEGENAGLRLGDLGEDRLVAGLIDSYPPAPAWLRVGPGDDAAVLALGPWAAEGLVASMDTMVADRDFRFDLSDGADVGVKLAAQNFADLAAMGARPYGLLVSLAAPAALPVSFARGLARGLAEECARAGAAMIGGDVSDAEETVLTATALGLLTSANAVTRSGARAGDVLALSGACGPSAAGLDLLRFGLGHDRPRLAEAIRAHLAPRPDYAAGVAAAAAGATAMIDTSDGLLRDAHRIARASAVSLAIDAEALPRPAVLDEAAKTLRRGPQAVRAWQLEGGEDHALLACFATAQEVPKPFRVIGRVLPAGDHPVLVDDLPAADRGWLHWNGSGPSGAQAG